MVKAVGANPGNLRWLYLPHLPMDLTTSALDLIKLIKEEFGDYNPDVIFIDPLYTLASTGSLRDDEVAGRIVSNLNQVKLHFNSTMVLVHHEHRSKVDQKGQNRGGDNAIFGSFIWKAWPDHILRFQAPSKKTRVLTCDTQHSGSVVSNVKLNFNEPSPLFLTSKKIQTQTEKIIINLFKKQDVLSVKDIEDFSTSSKSTIYRSLRKLINQGEVAKKECGNYVKLEKDGENGA